MPLTTGTSSFAQPAPPVASCFAKATQDRTQAKSYEGQGLEELRDKTGQAWRPAPNLRTIPIGIGTSQGFPIKIGTSQGSARRSACRTGRFAYDKADDTSGVRF